MSALAALLDGLVDYAGLFPPAALPMSQALRNYAQYRQGEHRAMLAKFVVPAQRLPEFLREASKLEATPNLGAWPLAVLAESGDADAIAAFNREHHRRWTIATVEAKALTPDDVRQLASVFPELRVYVETPLGEDLEGLVVAIAASQLCAKIRTGGTTPESFPAPAQVLRFLETCLRHRVAFKATAGLHHPLRGEYPLTYEPHAARGTMYGFLNVFLTAAFLDAGQEAQRLLPLLAERDAGAIACDARGISWRDLHLSRADVARARARFAGSFGSCSFEEPVQDLAALSLLPSVL